MADRWELSSALDWSTQLLISTAWFPQDSQVSMWYLAFWRASIQGESDGIRTTFYELFWPQSYLASPDPLYWLQVNHWGWPRFKGKNQKTHFSMGRVLKILESHFKTAPYRLVKNVISALEEMPNVQGTSITVRPSIDSGSRNSFHRRWSKTVQNYEQELKKQKVGKRVFQ